MDALRGHFDSYTWRARVLPMFIVLWPIGIACGLWLPNLMLAARLIGAIAGPLGLAMLLSQLGRDLGLRKQRALWDGWGGSPTVQMLRHKNTNVNPVIRDRYHQRFSALRPDLTLPSDAEESANPAQADQIYEACVQYVIGQTRDHKRFPLLFKENVNYGFRRNLWGVKPIGITICVLGLIACVIRSWVTTNTPDFTAAATAVALILIILIFWLFCVNARWVRITAEAYATRLLEACESL